MTTDWVVTGGIEGVPDNIGFEAFVEGGSYPIYLNGQQATPAGILEVGNFDLDPQLEVRVTSSIPDLFFISSTSLYVGTEEGFNTDYWSYPYHIIPPASASVVTFYDITY